MSSTRFWIWFGFAFPVVLQGAFAYGDGFLTAKQVAEGRGQGLPFLYHGGMWSDVVLFAPLMAYVISKHGREWNWWPPLAIFIVGFVASYAMQHMFAYRLAGLAIPEAHTHDSALTTAGWIHLGSMAAGIAVLALYYVATSNLERAEVWAISGLLFLHFVIGTHVPFRAWVTIRQPMWFPVGPIVDLNTGITLGGLAVVLALLSAWALRHSP